MLTTLWRRWRLRNELYDEQPERHPALQLVQVGELVPWKGTHWKVAAIREQPIPALILVPIQETRASAIGRLKEARREDRILTKRERQARRDIPKWVAAGEGKGDGDVRTDQGARDCARDDQRAS